MSAFEQQKCLVVLNLHQHIINNIEHPLAQKYCLLALTGFQHNSGSKLLFGQIMTGRTISYQTKARDMDERIKAEVKILALTAKQLEEDARGLDVDSLLGDV